VAVTAEAPVAAAKAEGFVRNTSFDSGSVPTALPTPATTPASAPAPSPSRSGFSDSADAPRSPGVASSFTAVPDLGSVPLGSSGAFQFVLPAATFRHADVNANASVTLEVRQADGQALPAWVKFDPATGTLSGQAPADFKGTLLLRITARDAEGRTASTQVELDVGGDKAPTAVPEAVAPLTFDHRLPVKKLASRPGLSEQLRSVAQRPGSAARLGERLAAAQTAPAASRVTRS
jgi:hypothetical protein